MPVKQIVFKTAERLELETTLVANQSIWIPASDFIFRMTVPGGPDVADNAIVDRIRPGDVCGGDCPWSSSPVFQ
mgnify:CR=1 FL=1